MDKLNY